MPEILQRHIVIGTAGHIDHGKSALVKALTGVDPDRLKEEKERGMTTDLGFVFYGDNATIIDVPGHEKFVRHMVAGASTVDIVLFVIAADDGIMPQTYEHLEILKLLAIKKGIVVITKTDIVKSERLQIIIKDVKELLKDSFLENAPIVTVSNITGQGIDELKQILDALIRETEVKLDRGIFRMPIDRCFTIKGFGTVVAGTVLSGKTKIGDELELLPKKKRVKIRGIEVHNKQVEEVGTGFRAAINLVGAEKDEIERGDVLAQVGYFEPSMFVNASLYLLSRIDKPLRNFERLRIHIGTKEVLGRVVLLDKKLLNPRDKAIVQFRLEEPVICSVNDRFVIRTYSPQTTIGGGIVLEPKATKIKGYDEELLSHLARTETAEPIVLVEEDLRANFDLAKKPIEIAKDINLPTNEVKELLAHLIAQHKVLCLDEKKELYYHTDNRERLKQKIIEELKDYHKNNPSSIGITGLELLKKISHALDKILFDWAIEELQQDGVIKISADKKIYLSEFKVTLEKNIADYVERIEKLVLAQKFQPLYFGELKSKIIGKENDVKKAYQYLLDTKILINIGEGFILHHKYVKEAELKLIEFLKQNKEIRVSQFRDLLNASRRAVLPLLIYFDSKGITVRQGDVRTLSLKIKNKI